MQTYTGACHCKAVTFKVQTDLAHVIECNCSHCDIKGLILTFVPETQFTFLSGEEVLEEYQFHKKVIRHMFCRQCGVEPFGKAKNKEGVPTVAINVRCLDGVDRATLTITPVNGKDY